MDYKALSFVLAGSLRQRVIKALQKPKTPSQLVKDLKTQDSSLSRTLKELEEHKMIE
ncbi:TPA: helix-turn-helix transcriptional regulator, partial [Candidatus Woesearchaeota archaeon]|nr:helix-turn-helix transcriptional regulator [Candidatus Woesearchaeota archaeon]